MRRTIALGACLLLMVVLGLTHVLSSSARRADAADGAPVASGPGVEVGKHYQFQWTQGPLEGTVLEAPRGNWVKLRTQPAADTDVTCWVNLKDVLYILEVPKQK